MSLRPKKGCVAVSILGVKGPIPSHDYAVVEIGTNAVLYVYSMCGQGMRSFLGQIDK